MGNVFNSNRRRTAIGWFFGAFFVVAALNIPKDQVRVFTSRSNSPSIQASDWVPSQNSQEWIGRTYGWPYARPVSPSMEMDSPGVFTTTLALNFLVALAIGVFSAAIGVAWQWSDQRIRGASAASKATATATLAILCSAVAVILFNGKFSAERSLARELENNGIVDYAIEVPAFLAQSVPSSVLSPFMRIVGFHLVTPPTGIIGLATRDSSPRTVSIAGSTISGSEWSRLVNNQTIHSLTLTNCKLVDFNHSIPTSGSSLQSLTMSQCVGVDSIIPSLRLFSNLNTIDFVGSATNVDLLCNSLPMDLQELRLSRDSTQQGTLKIHDLTQIQSLTLRTSETSTPTGLYSIDLRGLHRLSRLSISSSLVFDLTAVDVPHLRSITPISGRREMKDAESVQNALSIRKLTINDAPGLQEIYLNAAYLRRIALKNTPNLRRLSIIQPERGTFGTTDGDGLNLPSEIGRQAKVNQWISDIANCDGPTSLDLSGQALQNLDLSPIGLNPRIRELDLTNTGVRASQLTEIKHRNRIQSLNLQRCRFDDDDVRSLLSCYPFVEQLRIDADRLTRIDLVDRPDLSLLVSSPAQSAQSVRIVGCPNLAGDLILGRDLEFLELRDVSSLETLSLHGNLPADAVVEGLRDLEVVQLLGQNVREVHFASLLQCKSLRELTLAMPTIAESSLRKIAEFEDLTILSVSGAEVDDGVISSWGQLKRLQEVNLSHTKITGKSLPFLAACTDLRSLNISHTDVKPEELGVVAQMTSLFEIEVAGIGMTPAVLRQCLQSRMVDRINLSGSLVSQELLDVLVSEDSSHLRFIGLKHCRLQDKDVLRIASAHPNLAMDLDGNLLGDSVLEELASQGRLISCSDRLGFERWTHQFTTSDSSRNRANFKEGKFESRKHPIRRGDLSSTDREDGRGFSRRRQAWPKVGLN